MSPDRTPVSRSLQFFRPAGLLVLLSLAACGDGLSDVIARQGYRGAYAVTDSTTYQATAIPGGLRGSVRVTYTNHDASPIYFARCFPGDATPMYDVVRAGPDSLVPLELGRVWACVGGASTGTLAAGDSFTVTIDLSTFDDAGHPVPVEQRTGSMQVRFRLCWRYRSDSGDCEPSDPESAVSNVFSLLPPPTATAAR
jgi:hypothetical protein